MKKFHFYYFSIALLFILSLSSLYFLNSADGHSLAQLQKTNNTANRETDETIHSVDSSGVVGQKMKKSNQENYMPNVTIFNYLLQKGIEALPVMRLKDYIPFINRNQN